MSLSNRRGLAAGLAPALVGLALLATAVPAAASPDREGGPGRHRRLRARHAHARMHRAAALRRLELTDAQRDALRSARAAAEPVRERLATAVRALVARAKEAERTPETRKALRGAVKEAVRGAATEVEPAARELVASLSDAQVHRLVEAAARRGRTRTPDEVRARLTKAVQRALLAPRGLRPARER
jgi:hypothetical protein